MVSNKTQQVDVAIIGAGQPLGLLHLEASIDKP